MTLSISVNRAGSFLDSLFENRTAIRYPEADEWTWWMQRRKDPAMLEAWKLRGLLTESLEKNRIEPRVTTRSYIAETLNKISSAYLEAALALIRKTSDLSAPQQGEWAGQERELEPHSSITSNWLVRRRNAVSDSKASDTAVNYAVFLSATNLMDCIGYKLMAVDDRTEAEMGSLLEGLLLSGFAPLAIAATLGIPDNRLQSAFSTLEELTTENPSICGWYKTLTSSVDPDVQG